MIKSLHLTIKMENFNFFRISSLISWANTFKIQEFRWIIENFHHHSTFFMMYILRKKLTLPLFIIPLKYEIFIFLGFRHLSRGLTPLKFKNFDQKLKTSTTSQVFSLCLY